ncbi:MAG TPA: VOC family protein [Syntrophales bacterium]|nr:VOC family protein [Syntrophales bacterium]
MLKKIDHIGIAVQDMDAALDIYGHVYGLKPIKREVLDEIEVEIAFIQLGEVLIELLAPTKPGIGSIGQFVEENGEGFHHMAYRVADIDRTLQHLRDSNIPLRDQKPRNGGDKSRIAFIEPTATLNVLTELVERMGEVQEE